MRSLTPFHRDLRPLGTLAAFPGDLDRFFHEVLGQRANGAGNAGDLVRIDWTETDDALVLRAELPGVRADDLDITLTEDVLTLAGEKKDTAEPVEGKARYSERRYGAFRRDVQLPFAVANDQVRAEHADGVLTIHLPKSEAVRPRKIEVTSS